MDAPNGAPYDLLAIVKTLRMDHARMLVRQMAQVAAVCAMLCPGVATQVRADSIGSGYLAMQRWLHAADVVANESVTYDVCGWGFVDLRTPFLSAAIRHGIDVLAWGELAKRYDDSARERRRMEAALTAHGANAPIQRTTGLYATGGCADAVRERIERRATEPIAPAADR